MSGNILTSTIQKPATVKVNIASRSQESNTTTFNENVPSGFTSSVMPAWHTSGKTDQSLPDTLVSLSQTPVTPKTTPVTLPALSQTQAQKKSQLTSGNAFVHANQELSASTEEILKRVNAKAKAHDGVPDWEAAREQVLQNMATSESLLNVQGSPVSVKREKSGVRGHGGRLRASKRARRSGEDSRSIMVNEESNITSTPEERNRGRGRARGRGRGRGRGSRSGGVTKIKKIEAYSSEIDSDISASYTPLPTRTKSGRNINKPIQYLPFFIPPSAGAKRKRPYRRQVDMSVCKVCQRRPSPSGNMLVYCDSCDRPYHQFCHDPPIDREVAIQKNRRWLCTACSKIQEISNNRLDDLVAAGDLTVDEKQAYFSSLPKSILASLLAHVSTIYPSLHLFAPDTKDIISKSRMVNKPMIKDMTNSYPNDMSHDKPSKEILSKPAGCMASREPRVLEDSAGDEEETINNLQDHESDSRQKSNNENTNSGEDDGGHGEDGGDGDDGYDTDPPAHYPRPGNGLARTFRPESEDLEWLVDDNTEVFCHVLYPSAGDGGGGGGGGDGVAPVATSATFANSTTTTTTTASLFGPVATTTAAVVDTGLPGNDAAPKMAGDTGENATG